MKIKDAEIEQFRSPKDYLAWFENLLGIANSDPQKKQEALRHQGEFKFFYEEIFPLASLVKFKEDEWKETIIRNVRGNQNYDVELKGNDLSYIEIASAYFDNAELFRMNQLIKHKHVDALSGIKRNSKGKPVAIKEKKGMHLHDDLISEILSLIESRIQTKAKKDYPENTGLIIYFDDFKYYTEEDDFDRFDCLLESTKSEWSKTFINVSIVGPRAEKLFEKWK